MKKPTFFPILFALLAAVFVVSCSSTSMKEGVDKEDIRSVMRQAMPQVKKCYVEALKHRPNLEGKLVLEWKVRDKGIVEEAKVINHFDEKVENCILANSKTWIFPAPPSDQFMLIRYPFVFTTASK